MPGQENPFISSHRYQVLQDLGEGGIGKVYRCLDQWTGKEIALKILASDLVNRSLLESFRHEFLMLTQLRHPGVVEVFDFGYLLSTEAAGTPLPYFSMEFVGGKSLAESFPGSFDSFESSDETERFYHLVMQICDILEFIHLRELVHCDLKPDNIKITDHVFQPKILDFGLSEKAGTKRIKETKGTLPYMAPEMFQGEPLDARTDLYSLGVILYEMVTAKLPFTSDDPVKIVSAHLQQKPVSPLEINPHIPLHLSDLILRLLEKSPGDRPPGAHRVRKLLKQGFLSHYKKKIKNQYPHIQNLIHHIYSGPLVAREVESSRLEGHLRKTSAAKGGLILVSGEQGIGKSLLLKQLKLTCQLQGITVMDANCRQDQTLAYQPLVDICRQLQFCIEGQCSPSVIQNLEKIIHRFKEGPCLDPDNSLDGTVTDTNDSLTGFHKEIHDIFVEISSVFPLVMILDDLQWVDTSTLQFLEYCQTLYNPSKMIWCLAFREEPLIKNTPFQAFLTHSLEGEKTDLLKLSRFDLRGTRNLILSKLKSCGFPEEFFSFVHERTAGNPDFVLEVLKYLLEKNVLQLEDSNWVVDLNGLRKTTIPGSIESVLTENLKRYDVQVLDFLSVAAVVGKRFSLNFMEELGPSEGEKTKEILNMLTDHQLLIRKDDPREGAGYYEFANHSLQTILYRRLTENQRMLWHKKIGEILERRLASERDESVSAIAHHYSEAGENSKAYQYTLLAAEKMEQRYANQEALAYFEKALNLTSKFSDKKQAAENRILALTRRADFCKKVGELNQAEEDYQAVLKLVQTSSNLKMQVKVYNNLAEIHRLKHDYSKGISILQKAMQIHEKLDDPVERANTLSYLGLLYWTDSQYQNALYSFHKALEIDQRLGNKSYEASNLNNIGLIFWSQHQYSEALKYFNDSLSRYRELDNKEWIARCLNNIGSTLFELNEYTECIEYYLESLKLNEEIKNQKEIAFNLENLCEAYRKIGSYSVALEYGQRGLELATEIDFMERVGRILKGLGVINYELGNYKDSYIYLQKSREVAEKIEDRELQILVLINLAKFYTVFNDAPKSYQPLEEAIQIIDPINDERSLINVFQIRSRLARKNGQFEEALEFLNEASMLANNLSTKEETFSINLELAELYLESGATEKAKEILEKVKNSGLERYVLFQPTYYFISGKLEYSSGNLNVARKDFENALQLAEKLNHLEIMWRIHHQLGKLYLSVHDHEKAYRELEKGTRILKKIMENIEDKELKQYYMKDEEKRELLSDLKQVAAKLIGEHKIVL
jgi:serine/threonine protein kinase/tetratricopeptide (TPR) repeat protein